MLDYVNNLIETKWVLSDARSMGHYVGKLRGELLGVVQAEFVEEVNDLMDFWVEKARQES